MGVIAEIFGYLLNALYEIFGNYGLALITFSIILRLILIPITVKQQSSMKKSAALQGEMKEIQAKYKNDQEKMNQEIIELYRREKMSPFSGCFSSIIQIVIILSVFWLVSQPLTYMKKIDSEVLQSYKEEIVNSEEGSTSSYTEIEILNRMSKEDENYIDMNFFGLDLSKVPSNHFSDWTVYIIPILYVISSIISIRLTTSMTRKNSDDAKNKIVDITENKKKEEEVEDPMLAMTKNMTYMMPIMSVFIACIAPLGLALYWFMSNLLMIIEKLSIDKFMKHKEAKSDE